MAKVGKTQVRAGRSKPARAKVAKPAPPRRGRGPGPRLDVVPLNAACWADFEQLFGTRGACGGCWCMWWRLPRAQFNRQKGEENRQAMRALVQGGRIPGLLAYLDGQPVGWCSLGPRGEYSGLARSRVLQPVDEQPVWSVVCFFVSRSFRGRGIAVALLRAAVQWAAGQGARIVEGYPVEPRSARLPDAFAWTGPLSVFTQAGFREVLRRSATRPIVRCVVPSRRVGRA